MISLLALRNIYFLAPELVPGDAEVLSVVG